GKESSRKRDSWLPSLSFSVFSSAPVARRLSLSSKPSLGLRFSRFWRLMFSSRSSELMFSVIVLLRVTLAIVDYLLSLVFFISQIVFGGDTDQRIVVTVLDVLVFDDCAGVKTKSCGCTVVFVFAGNPRQSVCG